MGIGARRLAITFAAVVSPGCHGARDVAGSAAAAATATPSAAAAPASRAAATAAVTTCARAVASATPARATAAATQVRGATERCTACSRLAQSHRRPAATPLLENSFVPLVEQDVQPDETRAYDRHDDQGNGCVTHLLAPAASAAAAPAAAAATASDSSRGAADAAHPRAAAATRDRVADPIVILLHM